MSKSWDLKVKVEAPGEPVPFQPTSVSVFADIRSACQRFACFICGGKPLCPGLCASEPRTPHTHHAFVHPTGQPVDAADQKSSDQHNIETLLDRPTLQVTDRVTLRKPAAPCCAGYQRFRCWRESTRDLPTFACAAVCQLVGSRTCNRKLPTRSVSCVHFDAAVHIVLSTWVRGSFFNERGGEVAFV